LFKKIFTNYKNQGKKQANMGRIKYEPVVQLKKTLGDLGRDLIKIPTALKDWKYILKYLALAALINLLFYFTYSINIPLINISLTFLWAILDFLLVAFFLNGKKLYVPLIIWIDLTFLTFFGFVYDLYFQRIMTHATIVLQQTPSVIDAVQSQDIYAAAPMLQTVSQEMSQVKMLALMLAISVFVLWIAFEAVNWWNCFRISGRKTSYLRYLGSFSLLSAIWMAIVSLILCISITMFFNQAFSLAKPNESILSIGLAIAVVVAGYFALVSYSLAGKIKETLRKTVIFSFLSLKVLVSYIIMLAIAGIIDLIIMLLFRINMILALVIGGVLVLLLFLYARVYMINVVQKLDKGKKYQHFF
jgi:hypothetical protein